MSNLKIALGSLLGAVSATGNATTGAINSFADGVGMLNKSISLASRKQSMDHIVELENHAATSITKGAIQAAETVLAGEAFKEKSGKHAALFDQYFDSLSKKLASA